MSRLIDADDLIEVIKESKPLNWTDSESELQEDADYNQFIEMVNAQPTAYDIEKVVAELMMVVSHETCDMAIKALEKQIAKKVAHQGCYDAEGVLHIWNGINGVPYDLCPSCGINLCTDGRFGRDKSKMKYCENCGQKLDWE